MSEPILLRQDGEIEAISSAPSVNQTPVGPVDVPVPYQVLVDLAGAVGCLSDVFFNGKPAFVMDLSSVPTCRGDDAGTSNGVKSGTLNGEVKPLAGSPTVLAHGKPVIRKGDPCAMQGGNTVGIFTANPGPSPQPREEEPAPDLEDSLEPETEEEREPPPEAAKHANGARKRLNDRLARPARPKPNSGSHPVPPRGATLSETESKEPGLAALERIKAEDEIERWRPDETLRRLQREWAEDLGKDMRPPGMPRVSDASKPLALTPSEKLDAAYRAAFQDRLATYRYWTENPLVYLGRGRGALGMPPKNFGSFIQRQPGRTFIQRPKRQSPHSIKKEGLGKPSRRTGQNGGHVSKGKQSSNPYAGDRPSARESAEAHAKSLRETQPNKTLPTAVSAAVDKKTGQVYYGTSGKVPDNIHPDLRSRIPERSLEPWRVENCAEFNATNKALWDGSKIENLEIHTVRSKTGLPMPRCRNCEITINGATVTSDKL